MKYSHAFIIAFFISVIGLSVALAAPSNDPSGDNLPDARFNSLRSNANVFLEGELLSGAECTQTCTYTAPSRPRRPSRTGSLSSLERAVINCANATIADAANNPGKTACSENFSSCLIDGQTTTVGVSSILLDGSDLTVTTRCGDLVNVGLGVRYPDNSVSSSAFTRFLGPSLNTYSGLLDADVSSGQSGYAIADEICTSNYPFNTNTHVCTFDEIIDTYENFPSIVETFRAAYSGTSDTMWINNGPPAYFENLANDCSGWSTNTPSIFGSGWNFGKAAPQIISCYQERRFACCGQ